MIWWTKARAVPALTATLVGTQLLGLLIGDAELPVPALTGQSGQFLTGHLITLLPALLLLYGTGRGDLTGESVACRPLRGLDTALGVTTAGAGAALALLCHLFLTTDLPLVLGRNTAGYIGLALLLCPLVGHRIAGVLLTAIPLTCAATGWAQGGHPEPWAWILHPADSGIAFTLATTTLLVGVIVMLARPATHRKTG